MLYALGAPVSFGPLVVAYVVSVTLSGWLSALACRGVRLQEPGRGLPDPRRHVDPYGTVAAAIAGVGWARPVEVPAHRRGGAVALAVLTGPVVLLALGIGALAGFGAAHGPVPASASLLQNGLEGVPAGEQAWFLGALMATYVGALQVVPLPPLPGGAALFALAPRTLGWQKAHFQLVERNIGLAALIALLIIPLGGGVALLPRVLDSVLDPLVRAVSGG